MSGGFVTVTVSPSLASELACQRDGPGAGAGASTGTASRAGSEERREASKERARLDDQPDGDDEPDSARRGLTAKDHKSPHKRRRVVVVLDEYGCADDFIDSQHRRFIKLVGEWVDCARKIGDYRYAAFLADFYNSMKYAMPIIGHQELPGMATVLLEDILQNEDFYQELLDVVWRVDPRNYRSNALKLYSLFRGTRDVVTGVLPDDKTTDLVLAIDRIIALCYDKMCETPVVEIEDDSEDTQEQDGVDDDADVPEPAIARDSVTGGPVPKVQFYCGTERASAASGGRLVIPDIRNPLFHFN